MSTCSESDGSGGESLPSTVPVLLAGPAGRCLYQGPPRGAASTSNRPPPGQGCWRAGPARCPRFTTNQRAIRLGGGTRRARTHGIGKTSIAKSESVGRGRHASGGLPSAAPVSDPGDTAIPGETPSPAATPASLSSVPLPGRPVCGPGAVSG